MAWRAMESGDLPAVLAIAARVHPGLPEDEAVFAERLALHPAGCLVLDGPGGPAGYLLGHPWRSEIPVPLNARLGRLPAEPDSYYLHDLAILPEAQGGGAGAEAVRRAAEHARALGLPRLSLIAVNESQGFWARHGFVPVPSVGPDNALASYGEGALRMRRQL